MNNQEEMEAARADLEAAQANLAAVQKRLEDMSKPKKWEPKGGDWYVDYEGYPSYAPHTETERIVGSEYPTYEGAASAAPFITFYKRLCCLAQELNPSGKVGGNYGVFNPCDSPLEPCEWRVASGWKNDPLGLFETMLAAKQAAFILNRDGWELPQ